MKFVGLSGGIGAGKSTVRAELAVRGADVIDLDEVSRTLQEPGQPFYAQIVGRWGDQVVGSDGRLDRAALGAIVFHDPSELGALTAMAAPVTEAEVVRRASAHRDDDDAVVVVESALYLRPMYGMTAVVVVDTSREVAIERLVADRSMTVEEATARIDAQLPRATRLEHASHFVRNDGSREDLLALMDPLYAWIRAQPDTVPSLDRFDTGSTNQ